MSKKDFISFTVTAKHKIGDRVWVSGRKQPGTITGMEWVWTHGKVPSAAIYFVLLDLTSEQARGERSCRGRRKYVGDDQIRPYREESEGA